MVWNTFLLVVFNRLAVVTFLQILAVFLEVRWLYNNVWGATVAESENVFPGGDALS